MTLDLLESPVHVLTLQRASNQALMVLQDPPDYNEEGRVMFRKENNRNDPMGNQPDTWHTVKGEKDGFSLAVAARKSTAKYIEFGKCYKHEATYEAIHTGNTVKAKNRILFATVQLKSGVTEKVLSRDSGASTDELSVVSAQMNFMCANKKAYRSDGDHYKTFFDQLAEGIIEFQSRLVGAEMNAAFWSFIPEMRARGVQVNLAAWSSCILGGEQTANTDSVGIFIIGPYEAIRVGFVPEPIQYGSGNEEDQQTRGNVASTLTGRLMDTQETQIPVDLSDGHTKIKEWSFMQAKNYSDPAVKEIRKLFNNPASVHDTPAKQKEREIDNDFGSDSWKWFRLATFTQIILERNYIYDCHGEIWPRGAHTPLIVFGGVRMESLQKG